MTKIKTVLFWVMTPYGFVGVTNAMKIKVAKIFAQIVLCGS